MFKVNSNFIITVLFIFSYSLIIGQNETDSIVKNNQKEKSYFTADLNYISDAVFMGRKDSVDAPYLYPGITYHHTSGFYVKGSLSYLTSLDQSRIDLFLITAGFDFTVKNFTGDFSATKYFFNEDSFNVISEVEADITAVGRYDFDNVINLSIATSLYFSNNSNSDFFLSSELSHDIVTTNQKFQFSPTVGIYLGSQNFYEEYYMNERFGNGSRDNGQGSGNITIPTTTNVSIQESEKINLMAIELSLPMWYSYKSLTVSFLPTLAIPQSEANLVVDETLIKEDLKETFYWIVGFSYKLN
jgi:hypothetical protein